MVIILDPDHWPEDLADFSVRNAGRDTWLEIEDPLIGELERGRGSRLQRIALEPCNERVEIMLRRDDGGHALVHAVEGILMIDVLTDEAGRETALRIAQEATRTLLRLGPPAIH